MHNSGTAKVVLLSGVYIIIGMYSLGFNRADESVNRITIAEATLNQAEQFARAGINYAMIDFGNNPTPGFFSNRTVTYSSGDTKYTTDRPATISSLQARVTSTGTYYGHTVTVVAIVNYHNSHWKVGRVYVQPNAVEFTNLHY
jgi:hypothetical protein